MAHLCFRHSGGNEHLDMSKVVPKVVPKMSWKNDHLAAILELSGVSEGYPLILINFIKSL